MNDPRSASADAPGPKGQDELYALVYLSTAARQVALNELMPLVDAARRRNQQEGITGVLLYSHGNFMQYLEGPACGLAKVYEVIMGDRQHRGIIELLREPIQSREFADWSMAFRSISAFGISNPVELDAVFSPRSTHNWVCSSAARTLLSKFWNKGIGPGGVQIPRGNGQPVALPA
jgi:hypothetical protein